MTGTVPARTLQRQPTRYQAGTFIKTASPHIVEILGLTGLDFAVIDAEHAPLDRAMLDLMLLAGRAAGLPLLVRIPDRNPATILSALDMGAAGLLMPHVDTVADAQDLVRNARFRNGRRGYSGSPRFAGYGSMGMQQAVQAGDQALIICQIESPQAVENAAGIAAVPGVDGLFVGRADLALAMGLDDARHPDVSAAAVFAATTAERDQYAARGVN